MEDLEALLTDLQNTTEVLKRANLSERYMQAEDKEPIYQPQKVSSGRPASSHGLEDLEQLLDDYSHKRSSGGGGQKQRGAPTADSATRPTVASLFTELDDSLDDSSKKNLGPNGYDHGSSVEMRHDYARPQKIASPRIPTDPSQLDSMIGTLQSDMSKHGISTIPKGDCAACGKTIIGQVVIALGKMWHPEHYVCSQCGEELGHRNFFERSGKAYCENDYHNLFSPRCAYCNGPIKDDCGVGFQGGSFFDHDGLPLCETHYHEKRGSLCSSCTKPISGRCVSAMGQKFHPEHFVCSFCRRQLNKGTFKEHDHKPFCHKCYEKLLNP
uniref:LIM zinc-binding domain-containing protein n=1 Tax=Plectus sambesii TaxID=2011161 RepID=A0A914VYC2_9BILA